MLQVQNEDSSWELPTFQLQDLGLAGCSLAKIPEFLMHQTNLIDIDLSHNLSWSLPYLVIKQQVSVFQPEEQLSHR